VSRVDLPSLVADARRNDEFTPILEAIPYMRLLGLRAVVRDGDLLVHMPGADRLVGNPVLPALHGGTVGALLESSAILKLLRESDTVVVPKTIVLTVDYLRSARLTDTWARATITRLGRRVANVQVRAFQEEEDRPIALAHANFLLGSRED
jgi:uncharacterized protein (TIGR00369 family)